MCVCVSGARFRFGCSFVRLTALNCSEVRFYCFRFSFPQCRDLLETICCELLLIKQTLYGAQLTHNLTDNCLFIGIFLLFKIFNFFTFFCCLEAVSHCWQPAVRYLKVFQLFFAIFWPLLLPFTTVLCRMWKENRKRTYIQPAIVISCALLNSACSDMSIYIYMYMQYVCICCY